MMTMGSIDVYRKRGKSDHSGTTTEKGGASPMITNLTGAEQQQRQFRLSQGLRRIKGVEKQT